MQTWRDVLIAEVGDTLVPLVPQEGNPRLLVELRPDDEKFDLAVGYYNSHRKYHAMTHPEFTAAFNAMWPLREARREGKQAAKWEVAYEALLTEYQARATSLNGLTPPGMTREEFRALWETPGKGDAAYAAAVQGAFNATEVQG